MRRYYHITGKGRVLLREKQAEWTAFSRLVNAIVAEIPAAEPDLG